MLKRESEIYHNKGDSYGISLLSYKSGKSQRKQDQNSPSCSTQTKRTWSEWRPGAQSQATDKNVQFISSKNYFLLMKAAACIRHGCGPISQEETRRQKRPIAPARVARDRYNDFFLARNELNGWLRSWEMDVPSRLPALRLTSTIHAKNKSKVALFDQK